MHVVLEEFNNSKHKLALTHMHVCRLFQTLQELNPFKFKHRGGQAGAAPLQITPLALLIDDPKDRPQFSTAEVWKMKEERLKPIRAELLAQNREASKKKTEVKDLQRYRKRLAELEKLLEITPEQKQQRLQERAGPSSRAAAAAAAGASSGDESDEEDPVKPTLTEKLQGLASGVTSSVASAAGAALSRVMVGKPKGVSTRSKEERRALQKELRKLEVMDVSCNEQSQRRTMQDSSSWEM
jgi:hypothetical protein